MRAAVLPLAFALLAIGQSLHAADDADISLPLPRTQYTTAEPIELAILYTNNGGNAKSLPLEIRHADGSTLTLKVPFDAAGKNQTRLVSIRPGVLKPGRYTAATRVEKEKTAAFAVHLDHHPNPYWTAQWVHQGESKGTTLAKGGWMYMNSDLATLHPKKPAPDSLPEWYVAARMKPLGRMILGGGHQLDLDLENDWGDPWVQRTITQRMQLAALSNRIYPIAGLHCYDEPGLTWWPIKGPDGKTIETNPFAIPHQLEEFTKKTGKKLPAGKFADTAPEYAKQMDDWLAFMDFRMKYLEQAWVATVWGTESVEPKFLTINQVSSSYAPGDTTDGVDSRQNRPYKVVSGHGGYSDLPFGTMQPVRSAEAFQGLTRDRPHYFLPMWYTHTWASIRNAVWMSWTTKLDGIMYTPEQDFGLTGTQHGYDGTHTVFEIAEINRKLARVGAVLKQVPKTPAPVAVVHSHTQFAHDVATLNSPKIHAVGSPQYASPHRSAVDACFFRVMEQGIAPNWIDEVEAAEKGAAFLKQWKVLLCPRLATATPAFRKALEEYAAGGGKLVQFKGDKLILKGSIVAEHGFGDPTAYYEEKVKNTGNVISPAYRDLAWRKWNNDLAPTVAKDLAAWIGPQEFECSNKEVLLGVHKLGKASYLLFANNAQSRENPRGLKHELIATQTKVKLSKGVVYDLFQGGEVPVKDGEAKLRLAAGDGACWLHMPEAVEPGGKGVGVSEVVSNGGLRLEVWTGWQSPGPLPVRVRVFDPAGRIAREHFEAAGPDKMGGVDLRWFHLLHSLDPAGPWAAEVIELASGQTHRPQYQSGGRKENPRVADVAGGPVSVYFDDARRIRDLLAGKPFGPPYDKLNWDAKRVFDLDSKKFAVLGPEAAAKRIADALKGKGMTVEVNPKYEIKPFVREPGRGGAGISHGVASNLENIHAHTIVLPGHPLLAKSQERGHINREVNAVFPGPARAFIQWGIGCSQAGWQNVFVLGDTDAGMTWLLDAINGKLKDEKPIELTATVNVVPAKKTEYPGTFTVTQTIKTDDTPVGIGTSPDGKTMFILCYDGRIMAHDQNGQQLWHSQALLEGCALAVSPKGDRIAVAGYPGLLVLDAKDGKVLGGFRAEPVKKPESLAVNRMISVAWNDAGTFAAGGWLNADPKTAIDPVILDSNGKVVARPKNIAGGVMGAAFVPGTDKVLFGADNLTLVNAVNGDILWRNPVKGAQAFAFSADGKTAAAGGWGRTAAVLDLEKGTPTRTSNFDAVVGGVAFLPDGGLAVAVWGGTHPLMVSRGDGKKPEVLFQSEFGFQNVRWSPSHKGLIAAEQGGRLWLLDPAGKPRAMLSEDAGTTAYRLELQGGDVLLARMNRMVQRIGVR